MLMVKVLQVAAGLSCFALPAFAQMLGESAQNPISRGVGAAALENEAGRPLLTAPTNGFVGHPNVEAGYVVDNSQWKMGDFDADIKAGGPRLSGAVPFTPQFGAALSLQSYDYGFETDGSKNDQTTVTTSVVGALDVGAMTLGLGIHHQMLKRKDEYEFDSVSGGGSSYSSEETEGDASLTSFSLGAAFKVSETLRVAAIYRPKMVEKYTSDEREVQVAADGTQTVSEEKAPEIMSVNPLLQLAAAADLGKVAVFGGVERSFPNSVEHEIDRENGSRSASSDNPGHTIVSVGAGTDVETAFEVHGNVHNIASKDFKGMGLGIGADIVAGPAVIGPELLYQTIEMDVDDSSDDLELTRTVFSLAGGVQF